MTRYRLTVEYDGGPFAGWQKTGEGLPSVQGALEAAAARIAGAPVDVVGAGRTDAGVHARGQVAHLDFPKALPKGRLRDGLNAQLRPDPIAVLEAVPVAADFHARFHAVGRVYLYRLIARRADLALERGRAWRAPRPLDLEAMRTAAAALEGRHDFTTFRDAQCQAKSPLRTLDRLEVLEAGGEVQVWAEARSFLHRQVRSMVGALVEVGLGRRSPADVAAALAARDRARSGQVAPAAGLYLMAVRYPDDP